MLLLIVERSKTSVKCTKKTKGVFVLSFQSGVHCPVFTEGMQILRSCHDPELAAHALFLYLFPSPPLIK